MPDFTVKNDDNLTTEEKFSSLETLKQRLEVDFIEMAQLLSEIKKTKAFRIKGYKTFKEFVEAEHNISGSFAMRLINMHDLFITELDIDEGSVKQIGLDRLSMIRPLVKDAEYEAVENWMEKAEKMNTFELREEVKIARDQQNRKTKTLKDVYIEQYIEKMTTFFNCSGKELNFKLALYFQDQDLEVVKSEIKEKQRRYDEHREMEGTL